MERLTNSLYRTIALDYVHSSDKRERKAARKLVQRPFNYRAADISARHAHMNDAWRKVRNALINATPGHEQDRLLASAQAFEATCMLTDIRHWRLNGH